MADEYAVTSEEYTQALGVAREIEELKNTAMSAFLLIGQKGKYLKESGIWKSAASTWGEFTETYTTYASSTIDNYIGVWNRFVECKFLTEEEAAKATIGVLQYARGKWEHIAVEDQGQLKEYLIGDLKAKDKIKQISTLLPEQSRTIEEECDKIVSALKLAFNKISEVDESMVTDERRKEMRGWMDKIEGCLR